MNSIFVEVVFSGLTLLASAEPYVDQHSVVLIEAPRHVGSVYVTTGNLADVGCPPRLGCLLWLLDTQKPSEIYFPDLPQQNSQRLVGRSADANGVPVLMPQVATDIEDLTWIPGLSRILPDNSLEQDCHEGNGIDCGDGASGRFVIPQGRILNCHVAHLENTTDVVGFKLSDRLGEPRHAMGNAFMVRFEVPGNSIRLCNKTTGDPDCQVIEPDGGIVRILVRNAPSRCESSGSSPAAHEHFRHFYPALAGIGSGNGLPIPVRDDAYTSPAPFLGACEGELQEIDHTVMAIERHLGIDRIRALWQEFSSADLPLEERGTSAALERLFQAVFVCTADFPHSSSECDSSTYP